MRSLKAVRGVRLEVKHYVSGVVREEIQIIATFNSTCITLHTVNVFSNLHDQQN